MQKKRRRYIFSGEVQGVGFRYTAYRKASEHFITGWAKNLGDGTVEMEAQGYTSDLDALERELKRRFYLSDFEVECREIPIIADENDFGIK